MKDLYRIALHQATISWFNETQISTRRFEM
jgi:hypothetical protein